MSKCRDARHGIPRSRSSSLVLPRRNRIRPGSHSSFMIKLKQMVESRLTVLSLSPSYNYSLITYLPSSFLYLRQEGPNSSLWHLASHPHFTKAPAFPWGVSFPSCALPKGTGPMLQLQGSLLSHRTVLSSFQCGCMPLKIKSHLFVWYKENELWYSSHC